MNDRSGRNDPCPCGSGKKYKRCCLGNEPPRPLPTKAQPRGVPSGSENKPFPAVLSFKRPPEPAPRPRDEWDDWYDRYAYVNAGRERDIARVLPCLLDEGHETDDPLFDLIDLIRMAGLYEESRTLTFAAIKQSKHAQLMPWAVDELMEFAVFFLYQQAIEAGCTAMAMGDLRSQLAQIQCDPSEETLSAMLAHRSGTTGQIELKDLLGQDEPAGFNLYLLSLDFGRWLTAEQGMSPLVADTMRHFVYVCLVEMRQKSDRDPLVLHQHRLDKYLAQLLGFMSVMHLRGVATLIGMRHFSDFLAAVNVVDEGEHRRAKRICDDLWSQMHRALGDTAPDYAFLNRYL